MRMIIYIWSHIYIEKKNESRPQAVSQLVSSQTPYHRKTVLNMKSALQKNHFCYFSIFYKVRIIQNSSKFFYMVG
jgi:hypothetical protein